MGEATPPTEDKMKKSTHKGHCQVCGSIQRVHNNGSERIFTHGFTRKGGEWGYWTSAPCFGSSAKALEVSCDIVQDSIGRAYEQRDKLKTRVIAQEEQTADLKHYVFVYRDYETVAVPAFVSDYKYESKTWGNGETTFKFSVELTEYHTKEVHKQDHVPMISAGREFRTEEECLQFFRDAEINKLNAQIFELNEYAKAQSEVIDNWVAKPLIKIKEAL